MNDAIIHRRIANGRKAKAFALLVLGLVFALVYFVSGVKAYANPVQDNNIRVTLNASRPLVGNPRGTSTVVTRNANSFEMQVRTQVRNSNGTISTGNWWRMTARAGQTLNAGASLTSGQTVGTTRSGTVQGTGTRRATSTGAWSSHIVAVRAF